MDQLDGNKLLLIPCAESGLRRAVSLQRLLAARSRLSTTHTCLSPHASGRQTGARVRVDGRVVPWRLELALVAWPPSCASSHHRAIDQLDGNELLLIPCAESGLRRAVSLQRLLAARSRLSATHTCPSPRASGRQTSPRVRVGGRVAPWRLELALLDWSSS